MWQFRTTPNTLAEGDIATGLVDSKGNLLVTLIGKNGTNGATAQSPADAQANSAGLVTNAQLMVFNGTTWDRARSMTGVTDAVASTGILSTALLSFNGSTYDRLRNPIIFKVINTLAAGTEATIWTPAAGKKFRIMGFVLAVDTATTSLVLRDNTAGTTILKTRAVLNQPVVTPPMGNGILSAAANNVLTIQAGVANNVDGFVFGTEE